MCLLPLLLSLLPGCGAPDPGSAVVVIVLDSVRADALSPWSEAARTPAVGRLAAEGTVYRQAWSQAPWTLPSVGSLLTGRYPAYLGLSDVDHQLGEGAVLLSERLQAAGFSTGAVVSHELVGRGWGFDQGYDRFDDTAVLGHRAVTSARVSDAGIDFLFAHRRERFFLLLHYFDPHHTYRRHAAFDGGEPLPGWGEGVRMRELLARAPLDAAQLARVRADYDSEVGYTDQQVGRVLDALDRMGLSERTAVFLLADHGEEFQEHGGLGHTRTVYEELVHVPLIVRYPGQVPAEVAAPVALLDVVPTALALAGLPPAPELEGRELLRADPGPTRRGSQERVLHTETSRQADLVAVRRGDWKLSRDRATGEERLVNLRLDPGERRDASGESPAVEAGLRLALDAAAAASRALPVARPLDREEAAALEALGYAVE